MISTGSPEMDAVCAAYRSIIAEVSDEVAARAAQIAKLQAQAVKDATRILELEQQIDKKRATAVAAPAEGPPPF